MKTNKSIKIVKDYGHYSVTGPVKLPISLIDEKVQEFIHEGFKFPSGRYSALYLGGIKNSKDLLVRISSNCQWAFYFGSLLCDCKWQLEESKRRISDENLGLIIFAHDQNGKGVSIENHWKIYSEGQKRGLELVVDAYKQLGFQEDYRNYDDIVDVLKHYKVENIRLLTNNPNRIRFLKKKGFSVKIENLEQPINPYLKQEYRSKKWKLKHLLKISDYLLKKW